MKAPKTFLLVHTYMVMFVAGHLIDGSWPVTLSGRLGAEHFIFGCAIVGLFIGTITGWPRRGKRRFDVGRWLLGLGVFLGLEELEKIHEHEHERDD